MEQLRNFLLSLRGDVFRLLPMREEEMQGHNKHLREYIEAMIINLAGAIKTYPTLAKQRQYLYVVNNINYISEKEVDFATWRNIVLSSTKYIDNLYEYYGGVTNAK